MGLLHPSLTRILAREDIGKSAEVVFGVPVTLAYPRWLYPQNN